jgi:hypothetical protein
MFVEGGANWADWSMSNFTQRLKGMKCEAVEAIEYEEPAADTAHSVGTSIQFTDSTRLNAQFWRLSRQRAYAGQASWLLGYESGPDGPDT